VVAGDAGLVQDVYTVTSLSVEAYGADQDTCAR